MSCGYTAQKNPQKNKKKKPPKKTNKQGVTQSDKVPNQKENVHSMVRFTCPQEDAMSQWKKGWSQFSEKKDAGAA